MIGGRKKPGVAFWTSIILVVLLLLAYPLSFGPACWLADRGIVPTKDVTDVFGPIIRFMCSADIGRPVLSYGDLWSQRHETVDLICLHAITKNYHGHPRRF